MHNKIIKNLFLVASTFILTACSFFDKDNTPAPMPLTNYTPEVIPHLIWSTGTGSGSDGEYLKMSPSTDETSIYTTSASGTITSVNKANGRINWETKTKLTLTTGPGVGEGLVVAGSKHGDVIALQAFNGKILWKRYIPGEILAKPAISKGVIVIKAMDGNIHALSVQDGHEMWAFQQVEPSLILRGASTPLIRDRNVLIGFSNGNLAKFSLSDGRLFWMQPLAVPEGAFAIQRMIDIDADPIMYDHHIYAATYQGRINLLDWDSGRVLWSHDISSYTGMIADSDAVYISDAKSHVWAFSADTGFVMWRQTNLQSRTVSGPARMGNYVVVGDAEGYLHWLDKRDGHFAGRVKVGSGIYAAPIVENNVLYAFTNNGRLLAYTMR